jgi:hypothetical protein
LAGDGNVGGRAVEKLRIHEEARRGDEKRNGREEKREERRGYEILMSKWGWCIVSHLGAVVQAPVEVNQVCLE